VDDSTLLVLAGFPSSILTSSSLSQGSYYIVAIIVLLVFFFIFAIRAITEPIQRIAEAANDSDVANSSHIFEERGSIEIIALSRALNGMRSRIRVMVESRTRMLRGIGHDLRTPLTRLRLRTERMEEGALRDGLLSDIMRIDGLLAESLNYLRDEYAIEPFERADVASILQTVCDDFTDVGFNVCYSGPDRMIVTCKSSAMMRAINNLCDNGVKFGNAVTVRLAGTELGYNIIVADNGPGIEPQLQTRVFEPFFKIDNARHKENVGFGLGLSIVADIVHSHRGTITLSQNNPTGLKAAIFIPVSRLSAER
jgi:signal transduction histidine kinase